MIINGYICLMLMGVAIASLSQILLKKSARNSHSSVIQEYFNPYVIIGYGMLVISTIFNILALRGLEYKNAPVIESLGYILVMILSRIFFNEPIGRKKVIGNLFILIGVLIFYM